MKYSIVAAAILLASTAIAIPTPDVGRTSFKGEGGRSGHHGPEAEADAEAEALKMNPYRYNPRLSGVFGPEAEPVNPYRYNPRLSGAFGPEAEPVNPYRYNPRLSGAFGPEAEPANPYRYNPRLSGAFGPEAEAEPVNPYRYNPRLSGAFGPEAEASFPHEKMEGGMKGTTSSSSSTNKADFVGPKTRGDADSAPAEIMTSKTLKDKHTGSSWSKFFSLSR